MKKILITDAAHPLLAEQLRQQGFSVDYRPDISVEEAQKIIGEYTGLIINSRVPAHQPLLEKAKQLKFVCRLGSGLEVIDLAYARAKGIHAFNSPEGNKVAVAEHALAMLLALMNNVCTANAEVKQGQWLREKNRGEELCGKTVGLIAYGNNAQDFARLLSGFDVTVLAYDKYLQDWPDTFAKRATLQQIFETCDVLSLHLPLTQETTYMIDYGFLSSFQKPYWLVNTSRGKVMRTADMLTCLNEGKIKGAALDVLENEKLNTLSVEEKEVFDELCANDRIILSPHVAGWTHESKLKIAEVLLQKIAALQLV